MRDQFARPEHPNRLLAALPHESRLRLLADHRTHHLQVGAVLFEQGQPVERVYFPTSGMVSMITRLVDGVMVETASVGREGVVGLPTVLDLRETGSVTAAIAEVDARLISIEAEVFRTEMGRAGSLYHLVNQFSCALFALVGQVAACNNLHTVSQRCARWLLMTSDRIGTEAFHLTQEALSRLLGSRRASVTEAATRLQRAGAISYQRGELTIDDHHLLAEYSCECYHALKRQFYDLYLD